ncbi:MULTISPECIES: hypothetical protein [Pacificimonas]|nr:MULTISPECIES: hypothetical protein [Pacificimonas]MBZ6378436.1 hypothetical protein [Pacificimonas aurantium]
MRIPHLAFPLLIAACGNYSLPTEAEQAEAREELPASFEAVARADRADGRAVSLRWQVEDADFGADLWSWTEIEIVAETTVEATKAVRSIRSVSLDPDDLRKQVPAAYLQDAWALKLLCEQPGCIRIKERREALNGGEVTDHAEDTRRVNEHALLFHGYEARDRAIVLVRQAIGAPPR